MQSRRRTLAARWLAVSLGVLGASVTIFACGSDGGADPEPPADGSQQGPAPAPSPDPAPAPPAPAPAPATRPAVRVSFKLDPFLTSGLYMGDRWVSPPVFQAAASQTGSTFRVAARVEGPPGSAGAPVTWSPSDPSAVAVSPPDGREVEITVVHTGQSTLTVTVGEELNTLEIDADRADGTWRVRFSGN